jgi:hypothetical protein
MSGGRKSAANIEESQVAKGEVVLRIKVTHEVNNRVHLQTLATVAHTARQAL